MPRQSDLRFTFEPAGGETLEVVEFNFTEGLSQPFVLDVALSSGNPAVDFGQILDQPALFTIWRGETAVRRVHGLISGFTQGTTGFRRTRYHAIVEPLLARAGLRSSWRIFQQQSVPEILNRVLKGQGINDYAQHVTASHATREYCVQVAETDLEFLARLAAEEGLLYGFTHNAKGHSLIHTDRVQSLGYVEGEAVVYEPTPGGDQAQASVRSFSYTEQVRTAQQIQRDYTFKNPRYAQEHSAYGRDSAHQGTDYERYDYPGRYKRNAVGKPFTNTRLMSLRRDARVARIEGDDARIEPGKAFDLTGHPREEWNVSWRAVRVTHQGKQLTSQREESADSEHGTYYSQQAELIPANADWKAPIPYKPRIDGPQMATVTGPQGEEIYCDEFGRIKVQFPWDRDGENDEYSSCWIRVSQNWAGTAWGQMALPRIGHEVIVDFLDGDPDQPIVTGRTYHAANLPPYNLPNHKVLSTIQSKEHKAQRSNELRLDDTTEQISAALMSDHEATALHLGYLTHPRPRDGTARGEGFELRSDASGALRAAKGLLLSAEAQHNAKGGQLDRKQAIQILEMALDLARDLGNYAGQHKGVANDADPQQSLTQAVRDLSQGANNDQPMRDEDWGKPVIALSAPAGVAVATPRNIALGAGEHMDSVAQGNQHLTAGQAVVVNAGDGLGLFAKSGDMRHIAHQGEFLMQAQQNTIRLQADKSVEISASNEHILATADKHITLLCAGASITMSGGNIELSMPGTFTVKSASVSMDGPGGASGGLPTFKSPEASVGDFVGNYALLKNDESPFERYRYRIMAGSNLLAEGLTSNEGETTGIETERSRQMEAFKQIMRDEERITEDWKSQVAALDLIDPKPNRTNSPFSDDYIDLYADDTEGDD